MRPEQRTRELSAAVIRALSREKDVHFRAQWLYCGGSWLPLTAPHLHPSTVDLTSFRGSADGIALKIKHSDIDLHGKLRPRAPGSRLIFDTLEQFRVESLYPGMMGGIRTNLNSRFLQWSQDFQSSPLIDTDQGMLLFTVIHICRSRIMAEPIPEPVADLIESARFALSRAIGPHLASLRHTRHSQSDFGPHALAVSRKINDRLVGLEETVARRDSSARGDTFELLFDQGEDLDSGHMARYGQSAAMEASESGYRAFTREYDEEVDVTALVRPELLHEYREQIDALVTDLPVSAGRICRALTRMLSVSVLEGWEGGKEEGQIDGGRLALLLTSISAQRVFSRERNVRRADAALTFLIDCSGSMTEHSRNVSVLVDIFARACELADVRCEILGFTTSAWNGGRARRDWIRAGRPENPGRLNEVKHLVFKDADRSWRSARAGIGGLLKQDLYREGIDGEALVWACSRLRGNQDVVNGRRILMVVSDGSPMDGSTKQANDGQYLEHHLREAVQAQEAIGDLEILGLGLGLDLSPYYSRHLSLDLENGITTTVVNNILRKLLPAR